MISNTLVQSIEDHWVQICAAAERDLASDTELGELSKIVGSFRDDVEKLVRNLGQWLSGGNRPALAKNYEELGEECYQRGIPPHLLIRAVTLCKRRIQDFIRDQGHAESTVQIYAEEELELRVDRFFDYLVYWTVRGYWQAMQAATRTSAKSVGR